MLRVGEFDDATHFTVEGPSGAVGDRRVRYAGEIVRGWDIAGNANGGYLLGIVTRAMAEVTGRPPLSVTAHYLAPGRPGPAEVLVDVHRAGRRMATASADLRDAGGEVMRVLGTFAELREEGPHEVAAAPPELPPIDDCLRLTPPAPNSGFGDRVVMRVHPDDAGFSAGRPTGRAEIRGWFEFADRQPIDAFGLMVAVDSFAPVVFNLPSVPTSWAPTLELTAHVRGVPAPGPLRCRFTSRFVQGGMFEEDGEVWDSDGTLVAQSRQLALIPRPPT